MSSLDVAFKSGGIVLLKVGELAKRTGLTIRALHYYDGINLLKPSGRSEAGYRLYNEADVARLHSIQALRQLGVPLADISRLFAEGTNALPVIVSRQVRALEQEIAKAQEMRSQLLLIQSRIDSGVSPAIDEWLTTLRLMATYQRHFSADELRQIIRNWNRLLERWKPLINDIRRAMEQGLRPESREMQILARRWMDLSYQWMDGDFELLKRWGKMCKEEPAPYGDSGINGDLFTYISRAIDLRLDVLHRYLEPGQLKRLKSVPEYKWTRLGNLAEALIRNKVSMHDGRAKRLALRWSRLIDHMTDHDPAIREKLLTAVRNEPLLQGGITMSAVAREYIRGAFLAAASHFGEIFPQSPSGHA